MDTTSIITCAISAASAIAVAIITAKMSRRTKEAEMETRRTQADLERRAEVRKRESLLSMRLAYANSELSVGLAYAIKNGHANGEIEHGLEAVQAAQADYHKFHQEMANEAIQ